MIGTFVSIGNGTQDFSRLLDEVRRIAPTLPQPVIIQHGSTPFQSDLIDHFDFADESEFLRKLRECKVFITHGGGGSVFSAIRIGRKPVVVPRLKKYDEIVDDHQIAFTEELSRQGKIIPCYDVAGLSTAVSAVLANPRLPDDDGAASQAVDIVREAVFQLAPNADDGVLLVTPSGGHLTEMRNLARCYRERRHHFVINKQIVLGPEMEGRTTLITLSQRDWRFLTNIGEAIQILRAQKPRVILTTGGSLCVPFVVIGRLLGIPTVYVETVAKVNVPTLTGRIIYPFANQFYYQWPYLKHFFPKARFIGLIL